ncbi:MAG: bifunctional 4-hydroxy-3-methylbut-2-enyl diphosphate reductase/30S ribosomal protein S1, partial [Candidatus Bipolaricaulia bacterium]
RGVAILDPAAPIRTHRRRAALLSQTTKGQGPFVRFIAEFLERHIDELNEARIVNTTCPETGKRYESAKELARWADLMIVVGGRNSANTRRLAETCAREGTETHHIEDAAEIEPGWLLGKERIGVTAGASTPDLAIDHVVRRVEELRERSSVGV